MLYNNSNTVKEIEWVIFDEVHYINDQERGTVWEETIVMLPDHIGIVMLSATTPNYKEFSNWVGRTKRRSVFIEITDYRPVPLIHKFFFNGILTDIKNNVGNIFEENINKTL